MDLEILKFNPVNIASQIVTLGINKLDNKWEIYGINKIFYSKHKKTQRDIYLFDIDLSIKHKKIIKNINIICEVNYSNYFIYKDTLKTFFIHT